MTAPGINIRNLTLRYAGQPVFENLTFAIAAQNLTALLGPSGVGKTSLLRIIAGLDTPDEGSINATDGGALSGRIAYMAQQDLLLPWATVEDNVMLGATLRGDRKNLAKARELIAQVGLAGRECAMPAQLSGGMRQRAALARTLYEDRPIILMDEPFSALDAITRARIQELSARLLAGRTVLLVTHDPMEACRLSHTLLILSGTPASITQPIPVPGTPPRAPDDETLLQTQARLMRSLAA